MMILAFLGVFGIGFIIGVIIVWRFMEKVVFSIEKISEKHAALFRLMNNWVINYQNKSKLSDGLEEMGIRTVAIYGLSCVGETLYNELVGTGIEVKYGIDQSIEFFGKLPVYKKEDMLPQVDLIIVTAITSYKDIEAELIKKVNCRIISIEEIILMI